MDDAVGDAVDDPGARWDRAVELGALGRYAAAEALLRDLRSGPGVPPVLRAHAAVTRASHLRQVGAHAPACRLDAAAARLARPLVAGATGAVTGHDPAGRGPAAALGDAMTGLAADAIGRWDVATAERLLARAAGWCGVPVDPGTARIDAPAPTRTAVRWLWVRAEASLLAGDPSAAVRSSGTAVALAVGLGSDRHVLKSRLVHAVARSAAGERVTAELDAIADEAGAAGMLPLRWPALLAAADAAERDDRPDGGLLPGRHAEPSHFDTVSRRTVAQSRRHAAMLTTNALHLRADPVARSWMRESAWIPPPGAVPY